MSYLKSHGAIPRSMSVVPQHILRGMFLAFGVLCCPSTFAETKPPIWPIFSLTKGQGIEVCEAYRNRLNATQYVDDMPPLGRITEPPLEGFIDLQPVPLTAEEIYRIYPKLLSFYRYRDQDILERYAEKDVGFSNDIKRDNNVEAIKKNMAYEKNTPFVRFQTLLDLDNDGTATDTVIQNPHSAYIVDANLQRIDAAKMLDLFGDQEALAWPFLYNFVPLAYPLHVFGYKGKYYFDGFLHQVVFLESPHSSPMVNPALPLQFGVFLHEKQVTRQVCEYVWSNGEQVWKSQGLPYTFYR